MHELSIAASIVDIVDEAVESRGQGRVAVVHLKLGAMAGVVEDALLFSFEVAAAGTSVEGARLDIEMVPVTVCCPDCRVERTLALRQPLRCPECGTPTPKVVGGSELEVIAVEVEDD